MLQWWSIVVEPKWDDYDEAEILYSHSTKIHSIGTWRNDDDEFVDCLILELDHNDGMYWIAVPDDTNPKDARLASYYWADGYRLTGRMIGVREQARIDAQTVKDRG